MIEWHLTNGFVTDLVYMASEMPLGSRLILSTQLTQFASEIALLLLRVIT